MNLYELDYMIEHYENKKDYEIVKFYNMKRVELVEQIKKEVFNKIRGL